MSARKHTPGPWYWGTSKWGQRTLLAEGGSRRILATSFGDEHDPDIDAPVDEDEDLIAAAPEMFEALRELVEDTERLFQTTHLPPEWLRARAALAKAKGGGV